MSDGKFFGVIKKSISLPFQQARHRLTHEIIQAVLSNGQYLVLGYQLWTTSGGQFKAGDEVTVMWDRSQPKAIVSHQARRGGVSIPSKTAVSAVVEGLLLIFDSPLNRFRLFFRNDKQFTELTDVDTTILNINCRVFWGEKDNTFAVYNLLHEGPGVDTQRYFIYQLNRNEGAVLGSKPAAVTFVKMLQLTSTAVINDKYASDLASIEFDFGTDPPTPSCVLHYSNIVYHKATEFGPSQLGTPTSEYLTRDLDVVALYKVRATYTHNGASADSGRFDWMIVVSLTSNSVIWESPVTDTLWTGDTANCDLNGDFVWVFGTGKILRWHDTDPEKQLVALSFTHQTGSFLGSTGPGHPTTFSLASRNDVTFIENGSHVVVWSIFPWAGALGLLATGTGISFGEPMGINASGIRKEGANSVRFIALFADTSGGTSYLYDMNARIKKIAQAAANTDLNLLKIKSETIFPSEGRFYSSPDGNSSVVDASWIGAASRSNIISVVPVDLNAGKALNRDSSISKVAMDITAAHFIAFPSALNGGQLHITYHIVKTSQIKSKLDPGSVIMPS